MKPPNDVQNFTYAKFPKGRFPDPKRVDAHQILIQSIHIHVRKQNWGKIKWLVRLEMPQIRNLTSKVSFFHVSKCYLNCLNGIRLA